MTRVKVVYYNGERHSTEKQIWYAEVSCTTLNEENRWEGEIITWDADRNHGTLYRIDVKEYLELTRAERKAYESKQLETV